MENAQMRSVGEPKSATMKNGKLESLVQKMEKKDDAIKKSSNKFVSAASDESCKSLLKQLNGDLPDDQEQKPEQEVEKPS
jgi:hypothetical protein